MIKVQWVAVIRPRVNKWSAYGMCCTEIENCTDSAEITNVIETCPRYSRNLIWEGEVRVKYETKVPSRGCGRNGNATIEIVGFWILFNWDCRPSNRNSVFELLRQRRLEVIQLAIVLRAVCRLDEQIWLKGYKQLGVINIQMVIERQWWNNWAERSSVKCK